MPKPVKNIQPLLASALLRRKDTARSDVMMGSLSSSRPEVIIVLVQFNYLSNVISANGKSQHLDGGRPFPGVKQKDWSRARALLLVTKSAEGCSAV
jgi:hypothetical protein